MINSIKAKLSFSLGLIAIAISSIAVVSCEKGNEESVHDTSTDPTPLLSVATPIGGSYTIECDSECPGGDTECKMNRVTLPMPFGPMGVWLCSCEGCNMTIWEDLNIRVPMLDSSEEGFLNDLYSKYPLGQDLLGEYLDSMGVTGYTVDSLRFENDPDEDYYSYTYFYVIEGETEPRNMIVIWSKKTQVGFQATCSPPCSEACLVGHGVSAGDFVCSCSNCVLKVKEVTREVPEEPGGEG